jgi:hypothetical protein
MHFSHSFNKKTLHLIRRKNNRYLEMQVLMENCSIHNTLVHKLFEGPALKKRKKM